MLPNQRDIVWMRSLEDELDGRRDITAKAKIRNISSDQTSAPSERFQPKLPVPTESLRFRQIGFSGEERLVQIPKSGCCFVEDVAELRQLVSAGYENAMMKLAATERPGCVH